MGHVALWEVTWFPHPGIDTGESISLSFSRVTDDLSIFLIVNVSKSTSCERQSRYTQSELVGRRNCETAVLGNYTLKGWLYFYIFDSLGLNS